MIANKIFRPLLCITSAALIGFRQYLLNELLDECDILAQLVSEPPIIFGNIVHWQMWLINAFTLDSDEEIWHVPNRNSNTPTMVPPKRKFNCILFWLVSQVAPSTNLCNNNQKRV